MANLDEQERIPSEELLARKWDRCISNFMIKLGVATSVGIITSVVLLRKRTWPIALSAGFGLGMAYEQCQRSFDPFRSIETRYVVKRQEPLAAQETFLLTDSYKATHHSLYPDDVQEMVAYGEFRKAFNSDLDDQRIVFYGIHYYIEQYLAKPWTVEDLTLAEQFMATFGANHKPHPFPAHLFRKMIADNEGYFPVRIEALPEGSVVYPHVPVYQITASAEYAPLVTYLETLLTMIWYPSTVATLSRRAKHAISQAFESTVDGGATHPLLSSRLHDFGFRGCTSVEQSVIGGCAHLLNFDGSDTMSACFYAQFHLNGGVPVGSSIPATEHSVMTAWPSERAALVNFLNEYGDGVCACVMDSYDYVRALEEVLPTVKALKTEKGGFLVLRPDSGDPIQTVLSALAAAERIFGVTVNSRGFKVPIGVGVIQGDGINEQILRDILRAVEGAGFSAECVAFGMGGGLLQKVNRDTMSFATKLSCITKKDGTVVHVMKVPKTDQSKNSLPGRLAVVYNKDRLPVVYPHQHVLVSERGNALQVVYDGTDRAKRHVKWDTFTETRERIEKEWNASPSKWDPISTELKEECRQRTSMWHSSV